jgi:hypothetical protein
MTRLLGLYAFCQSARFLPHTNYSPFQANELQKLGCRGEAPPHLTRVKNAVCRSTNQDMNINKAIDKADEGKSFKELEFPISTIQGISESDAEHVKLLYLITN